MSLTLIKEDGSGKVDANTYATVADCDAYHAGHLYASDWTLASRENNAKALVMATRLIDALFQFNGARTWLAQALEWPRSECPDPSGADFVADNVVPQAVVDATCEMARELLKADRTAGLDEQELGSFSLDGAMKLVFDRQKRATVLTTVVLAMLGRFGETRSRRSGSVRLVRA